MTENRFSDVEAMAAAILRAKPGEPVVCGDIIISQVANNSRSGQPFDASLTERELDLAEYAYCRALQQVVDVASNVPDLPSLVVVKALLDGKARRETLKANLEAYVNANPR